MTFVGGVLPFCRDTVGVFYSPSRQAEPKRSWYTVKKRNQTIYMCMYVIDRQTVSLYHHSSVWLDLKMGSKLGWHYASWTFYCTATRKLSVSEGILTHMYHYCFVYIYPLNRCFARVMNPRWGEYILSSTDCFVISQLIRVARHARSLKLGPKPGWLYASYIYIICFVEVQVVHL